MHLEKGNEKFLEHLANRARICGQKSIHEGFGNYQRVDSTRAQSVPSLGQSSLAWHVKRKEESSEEARPQAWFKEQGCRSEVGIEFREPQSGG